MVVGSQQLDDTECKVQVEGYQIGEERDGGKCGLLESPAPNMCLKCGINANDLLVLRRRVLKRCSRLNAMICSFYSAVSVPKCHRFEQALWA